MARVIITIRTYLTHLAADSFSNAYFVANHPPKPCPMANAIAGFQATWSL